MPASPSCSAHSRLSVLKANILPSMLRKGKRPAMVLSRVMAWPSAKIILLLYF